MTNFIDIGHTRVAYERQGQGPDVLFIHGWPLHRGTWRDVAAGLPGYTCHLIDLPGMGESRPSPRTPTAMPGLVDSVDAVLDQLGLDQVTLVGHDSGGLIARYVAAGRPDEVAALVLSGTETPRRQSLLFRAFVGAGKLPGAGRVMRRVLSSPTLTRSPVAFGGAFADPSLLEGSFRTDFLDPWIHDDERWDEHMAVLRTFTMEAVRGLAAAHARLTAPVLLIWGADDPFFPVAHAREMADEFAGPARLEVVGDAKLLVHAERPQRFAQLTDRFLDLHLANAADQARRSHDPSP